MYEIDRILNTYRSIDFGTRKAALATVVKVQGSSYRRPGARMIITDDGRWTGAISGGCLEGDALRKARAVMQEGVPRVVTYDTMDDEASERMGVGLGCNGIIDVLIEPILPGEQQNHLDLLEQLTQNRQPALIATVFAAGHTSELLGQRCVWTPDGKGAQASSNSAFAAFVESEAPDIMASRRTAIRHWQQGEEQIAVLMEVLLPPVQLIIFGGGYDVAPVVKAASALGWEVTVTDDCVAHTGPKRFPEASCVVHIPRDNVAKGIRYSDRCAALLMSHNYRYDLAILRQLVSTPLAYIGILGPRKRGEKLMAELNPEEHEALHKRTYYPVGLDIGAETPEEIALSALAEIMAVFSQRQGGMLSYRQTPIHEQC